MKKTIITLLFICFAFGVKAQTFEKMPDTKPALGGITLIDYNALDTLKCWFKEGYEVILNNSTLRRPGLKDSILYAGDTVIYEKWHRGYMIVKPNGSMKYESQGKWYYFNSVNFLYSDRKTVVKNRVLEHIEL